MSDICGPRMIASLFLCRRPSAIGCLVSFRPVDSVEGSPFRPLAHICEEVTVGELPSLAHDNSFAAVSLVTRVFGVKAPLHHGFPRPVGSGLRWGHVATVLLQSPFGKRHRHAKPECLRLKTPAACGVAPLEGRGRNLPHCAALAPAEESCLLSVANGATYDSPPPKRGVGQYVYLASHKYPYCYLQYFIRTTTKCQEPTISDFTSAAVGRSLRTPRLRRTLAAHMSQSTRKVVGRSLRTPRLRRPYPSQQRQGLGLGWGGL